MKVFEFDSNNAPSGAFPKKSTETFNNQADWVSAMQAHGADEFLKEKEFNLDLIYAVGLKGTRLKGTWSDKKNLGVKYKGKKGLGLQFEKGYGKSKRFFTKANIGESAGGNLDKKYKKLVADHTDMVTQDGVPPSDLAADLLIQHKWLLRYFSTVGIVMKQKMKQQLAIDLS